MRSSGDRSLGKHNRPDVMPTDRIVIGSVRNPWDWYVSLWAFGCGGAGAVRGRTTRHFTRWYYGNGLAREMVRGRWPVVPVVRTILEDVRKPVRQWRDVYRDAEDPRLFRRWLGSIMNPRRRFDLGEGYGFSPLSRYAGPMTYRYIKLFSRDISALYTRRCPADQEALFKFEQDQNALSGAVVRTERLEEDLIHALELAGYQLTSEQRGRIRGGADERPTLRATASRPTTMTRRLRSWWKDG